ncbi:hypothetical protein APR09_006635 [Nocardia amikacinitolerans]|nr:hypothetical protein [Nocardia amikacinitolerans]
MVRGPKREFISRCYKLILRASLQARFSDAQCGFKGMRTDVGRKLLPLVEDGEWFFDTELLMLAERAGLRIHEVPVDWVDDPDCRVDIIDTAREDLLGSLAGRQGTGHRHPACRGIAPIHRTRTPGGRRAAGHGRPVGAVRPLIAAIGTPPPIGPSPLTCADRPEWSYHIRGLLIFGLAWLLTGGSLFVRHRRAPAVPVHLELFVFVVANLVATLMRFVGLRWVFRNAVQDTAVRNESPAPAGDAAVTEKRSPA